MPPQAQPLAWSLRTLSALFYYGHVHGEDLYGRSIRELNQDPTMQREAQRGAGAFSDPWPQLSRQPRSCLPRS